MSLATASVFEIVRLADLQSPGESQFCLLIASRSDESLIEELRDELHSETLATPAAIDAGDLSLESLIHWNLLFSS